MRSTRRFTPAFNKQVVRVTVPEPEGICIRRTTEEFKALTPNLAVKEQQREPLRELRAPEADE
jgi:hypothetical protein